MADVFALTSRQAVKELLGTTRLTRDTEIDALILAVSGMIAQHLGRDDAIESRSRTEDHDVERGQREWQLRAKPITSITSVSFDIGRDFAAETVLGADDYSFNGRLGLLRFDYPLWWGQDLSGRAGWPEAESLRGALRVVYTGGLAASLQALRSAHPNLELACQMAVVRIVKRQATTFDQVTASGPGSAMGMPAFDLTPYEKALLAPYRRPRAG